MTKTQKTVSDLLVQHLGQCSRAIEINETETRKLYFMTCRILRGSLRRKINSTAPKKLAEFAIQYIINKKEYEKRKRSYRKKIQYLDNSLDDSIRKIQKANAKELFKIIKMNMKSGPEKTIELVVRSFTWKKSLTFNGMTLLEGEVKKISLMESSEKYNEN